MILSFLLQAKSDRFQRGGPINGKVLPLITLNEDDEKILSDG
jgi:hypothetical protein